MTEKKTVKVKNVSPLGEVVNYLARKVFKPGEVVELPADIAGYPPFLRDMEDAEEPVAGHSIVIDGVRKYADPGEGLLAQVENFQLVVDEPAPSKPTKAPTA